MKPIIETARLAGVDESRMLARVARPRPLYPAPPRDLPTRDEFTSPISDGAVWMFLVILFLTILAAGYLFWAKIASAWPFGL